MSERYSKLFALPENLYAAGSPVVIAAGALLKDSQTGKVIAQLKMRNISKKPIKAAKVSIQSLDTVGNPLGAKIEYQYLDLNAIRGEDFGQKVPVALADATTRSFTVSVEEIVFADNSIWSATGEPWEVLDAPGSLHSIGDAELIKQFRLKYGNNCKNLPLIEKDLWYCACGELNRQGEAECHRCHKSLALLEQIDMDELCKEKDVRVAAEKEQAEKEAAESKTHAKKMGKILAIVVPILVVLIVAAVIISNYVKKSNAYEDAVAHMNAGQYAEAIDVFAALGDYKDSTEQIKFAQEAKEEADRVAELDTIYSQALSLMENCQFIAARELFLALGEYKDAKNLYVSLELAAFKESVASTQVGNCIEFGSYEQDDNPSNGKEPINWFVLEKLSDGGKTQYVWLISEYGLDLQPYNSEDIDVTWETCSLRRWLNTDFLAEAFNSDELMLVSSFHLENPDNFYYETDCGNDTEDKVFLLSAQEANQYCNRWGKSEDRVPPTAYTTAQVNADLIYPLQGIYDKIEKRSEADGKTAELY